MYIYEETHAVEDAFLTNLSNCFNLFSLDVLIDKITQLFG